MTRAVAIIQARMGSTRLPGKVLADLAGRPLILHVVERVQACPGLAAVVVTIPGGVEDDPLAQVLRDAGLSFHRNQRPPDLLRAYVETARATKADLVMRVTGDCPLWAPDMGEVALQMAHRTFRPIRDLRYPGLDVEILPMIDLCRADQVLSSSSMAREHAGLLSAITFDVQPSFPWLAVDTAEDLARVRAVHAALDDPMDYTLAATLRACRKLGLC